MDFDTTFKKAEHFLPSEEIRSQTQQFYSHNHTWRTWDAFVKSCYLETNLDREQRKLPDNILLDLGFCETHIEKYIKQSGNMEAGFFELENKEDIKQACYAFRNITKLSNVEILKEIIF